MNETELQNNLSKIKENGIYLVYTSSEEYRDATIKTLNYLISLMKSGIYVSLNLPKSSSISILKNNKVNTTNISYITIGDKNGEEGSTTIQSPQSLTEVSIAITNTLLKGNFNFLLFDSLSTLLIYHDEETIEKFIHFLINKMRALNFHGTMILLNEEKSNRLLPFVSQFSDATIKIL